MAGLLSRALDLVDAIFDAFASLWRVLVRGAFTPDARTLRGARVCRLQAKDVWVQEIALNAGDFEEARKAVLLDAERYLPLASDAIEFDIAGPVDAPDQARTRPERTYLLAVARKDQLEAERAAMPAPRRAQVEVFIHIAANRSDCAFSFRDARGNATRRRRRLLLALSLSVFAACTLDAFARVDAELERRATVFEAGRAAATREVRLAQRRLDEARALAEAPIAEGAPIADLRQRLVRLASQQHTSSELTRLVFDGASLNLDGRVYEPEAAELALRRAFEQDTVSFSTDEAEGARSYSARIGPS